MDYLEELEDIRLYDAAKSEPDEFVSADEVFQEIDKIRSTDFEGN